MFLFRKNLSDCVVLEPCKINLDLALSRSGSERSNYCYLIGETDLFRFYAYNAYSDHSGGYILRQDKINPRKICFFGRNTSKSIIFQDFLINFPGGMSHDLVAEVLHTRTGQKQIYHWFGFGLILVAVYGGDIFPQDDIQNISINKDCLLLKIRRKVANFKYKGDPRYNIETEYSMRIVCKYEQLQASVRFNFDTHFQDYSIIYAQSSPESFNNSSNSTNIQPKDTATASAYPCFYPKFCKECGHPLSPNAKFCENCGTKIISPTSKLSHTIQSSNPKSDNFSPITSSTPTKMLSIKDYIYDIEEIIDLFYCESPSPLWQNIFEVITEPLRNNPDVALQAFYEKQIDTTVWTRNNAFYYVGCCLESGQYHLYRGLLSDTGKEYLRLYEYLLQMIVESGDVTKEWADKDREILKKNIASAG